MLAMLDGEQKAIKEQKRGFRTVKIDENDSWLLRFIPYTFGDSGIFYLKIANHWIMKKPHFCPKMTAPEAGGDPNYQCQLCDETEAMINDTDQDVRKAGFKGSATQQWLMYCWVMEREIAKKGEREKVSDPDELWTPWEYWHNKWGFEQFIDIFRKCGLRERNKINVLDFMDGCNFWAKQTTKGINLQREDSGPIADAADDVIQQIIDFAWAKIRVPTYARLTDEQIDAALVKLDESVRSLRDSGTSRAPRTRYREREDDGGLAPQTRTSAPRVGTAASRPAPAVASPKVASPPAAASRTAPPAARTSAPPPRATAPPPQQPAEEPPPPPPPDPGQDGDLGPQPPRSRAPSVRAATPASPAASGAPRPSLGDRLRARGPAAPAGAPAQSTIDPEEDNVTDERRDPAPPAEVPVGGDGGAEEPPPDVSAAGSTAPPRVAAPANPVPHAPQIGAKLRSGIAAAAARK
jgi:hypothetical protein